MAEANFVQGIRVYKPHDNAPTFVIANGTINRDELLKWLQQQEENIRFDIKLSQKGGYYIAVNDFKPQSKGEESANKDAIKQPTITDSDLPF